MLTADAEGSSSSTTSRRAPRGSACLTCRRRKHKCDGVRPVCGPCLRSNREAECEYLDGPRSSRRQVLEEQISRLEGRIQELEQADNNNPSGPLHIPRIASPEPQPNEASTLSPARNRSNINANLSTAYFMKASSTLSSSLNSAPEPSPAAVQLILHSFLMHCDQVGFFLHRARFVGLASLPRLDPSYAELSPALLNSVYLWGVHFSTLDALLLYEPVFLARVTQALSSAVAYMPAYNVIYTIQAEILIANYYLTTCRLVEGNYHRNAAVALALSCGLYQTRAMQISPHHVDFLHAMDFHLSPPHDSIEAGERAHAFWHVYILDKCWAAAGQSPSHFDGSSGVQVDTPWPLAIEEYEVSGFPPGLQGLRTVEAFLCSDVQSPLEGTSLVALHAKAAALLDRATALGSRWSPTSNVEEFAAEFITLDSTIYRFLANLLPIGMSPDPNTSRKQLLIHTLCHVATIELHRKFNQADGLAESKDLRAAKLASTALDSVEPTQLLFVDPILAILWATTCQILIDEMVRLRSIWASTSILGASHSTALNCNTYKQSMARSFLRSTKSK